MDILRSCRPTGLNGYSLHSPYFNLAGTKITATVTCGEDNSGRTVSSFNLNEKDWADAEVACVAVGGNLASIHTEDHYNFVKGLIKTSAGTNKQTWVGGTDAVKEGVWLWSDGSNFDFTFWGPRQPDNAGRSEDCMALVNKGVANDMPCTQKKSYICGRGLCGRRTPASDGRFFSI
uniref:galactose-specific lectin nattectin-like n=1 Tax=Monopterus albus TaxID=43700 RepID=UPI0009B302FA|nr:galactose-specific lectin nattectin-like [Monopterus albus]